MDYDNILLCNLPTNFLYSAFILQAPNMPSMYFKVRWQNIIASKSARTALKVRFASFRPFGILIPTAI